MTNKKAAVIKPKKRDKGFTFTEILVVVLIIAVLAAVGYPMYSKSIAKSRAVEAINLLEMVRNRQIQKYVRDRNYYADFSNIGQLTARFSFLLAGSNPPSALSPGGFYAL